MSPAANQKHKIRKTKLDLVESYNSTFYIVYLYKRQRSYYFNF